MGVVEVVGLISAIVSIISFIWFLYDKRSPLKRLSWRSAQKSAQTIADKMIADNFSPSLIFGIGRGGAILGSLISGCIGHRPLLVIDRKYSWSKKGRVEDVLFSINLPDDYLDRVLVVAGEAHSGGTMSRYYDYIKSLGGRDVRRAVLLLEEGCPVSIEYYGIKSSRKNLLLPWMFSKKYRRDDRKPSQGVDKHSFRIKLYLVRHAESSAKEDLFAGTHDFDLTTRGVEQAVELGRSLLTKKVNAVYSSPLGRAIKTAKIIHGFTPNADFRISDCLQEMYFGAWEGHKRTDIKTHFATTYNQWSDNPITTIPDGADRPEEVLDRMISFLHDLERTYASAEEVEVVAVSHKTAIRLLLCHLEGRSLADYRKIEVRNAKPFVLVFDGTKWVIPKHELF